MYQYSIIRILKKINIIQISHKNSGFALKILYDNYIFDIFKTEMGSITFKGYWLNYNYILFKGYLLKVMYFKLIKSSLKSNRFYNITLPFCNHDYFWLLYFNCFPCWKFIVLTRLSTVWVCMPLRIFNFYAAVSTRF